MSAAQECAWATFRPPEDMCPLSRGGMCAGHSAGVRWVNPGQRDKQLRPLLRWPAGGGHSCKRGPFPTQDRNDLQSFNPILGSDHSV
jgi:hypothetical protein